MKKSNRNLVVIVLILIIVSWGVYKFNTRLPKGSTDPGVILQKASPTIDTDLEMDIAFNPYEVNGQLSEDNIKIYLNGRTHRNVFPIKDVKKNKIHFCYLVSYKNARRYTNFYAIDIKSHWARLINKKVATIEGNNPRKIDHSEFLYDYFEDYSNISDSDYNYILYL